MPLSATALSEAIAAIVGRQHVLHDPSGLAAHAVDGVAPRWWASPGDIEQVSRLLALASTDGLAVTPRGSGAAIDLGNPPRRLDLVLDCRRLDRLLEYVPEDLVASVQAGASLASLGARLGQHRQQLAIDPTGGASRTLGGVLATNASGPLRFRYGTARDLLLGVRFVQADGTVTWGGAKVVKSVTGYDVPKLIVGALGTLGVIGEVTLRLHPVPPASGGWLFGFETETSAAGFVKGILASTLQPDRVSLLNDGALRRSGQPVSRLAVAVSVSSVPEAVASHGKSLEKLAGEHGVRSVTSGEGLGQGLSPALDGPLALRLACEISRLVPWLGQLEARVARLGGRIVAVGEAGSGVLRAAVGEARLDGAFDGQVLTPLRDELAREGGSLVLERAPLELKKQLDVWGPVAQDQLEIMRRLKQEFDPAGILNPGRFVGGI
jgi:glycolate oxidase FAD binding subunit